MDTRLHALLSLIASSYFCLIIISGYCKRQKEINDDNIIIIIIILLCLSHTIPEGFLWGHAANSVLLFVRLSSTWSAPLVSWARLSFVTELDFCLCTGLLVWTGRSHNTTVLLTFSSLRILYRGSGPVIPVLLWAFVLFISLQLCPILSALFSCLLVVRTPGTSSYRSTLLGTSLRRCHYLPPLRVFVFALSVNASVFVFAGSASAFWPFLLASPSPFSKNIPLQLSSRFFQRTPSSCQLVTGRDQV